VKNLIIGERTMKHIAKTLFLVVVVIISLGHLLAQSKRPLEFDDLLRVKRISEPALSPDGRWIVFTVTIPDKEANKNRSDLWIISAEGGAPRQLTSDPANEKAAAWSPNAKTIAFQSDRSGMCQIWLINPDGTNERLLGTTSTESTQPVWSPDGNSIAYVSTVSPEFSNRPFAESNQSSMS
jgi:Tol biopolymer transport system component